MTAQEGSGQLTHTAVLADLADAVKLMRAKNKEVALPPIYNGTDKVEEWFIEFEAYCEGKYKEEQSYLSVLPTLLDGAPKKLQQECCSVRSVKYQPVKDTLRKLKKINY